MSEPKESPTLQHIKRVMDRDKVMLVALNGIRNVARKETMDSKGNETVLLLNNLIDALDKYVKGSQMIIDKAEKDGGSLEEHDYTKDVK